MYFFFPKTSSSISNSSLSNIIFENASNDRSNEVNTETSKIESYFSSESERNKAKQYCGSHKLKQ